MVDTNNINKLDYYHSGLPQVVKNLPIDALRMFHVLTEVGNISKTAQIIGRSQPAVSLQLKKLEGLLNTTLFAREKGSFALTRDGQILLTHAQEILRLNDSLVDLISHQSDKKVIRLGLPNDYINTIWPQIYQLFKANHPNVNIEVYEDISVNLIKMMHENTIDMALSLLPKDEGQYCIYSVKKPLLWVGRSSLARLNVIPLVACFRGCSYRHRMEKGLKAMDKSYNFVMTTNNFQTINDLVSKGIGITAVIDHPEIEKSGLNIIDSEHLPPLEPLYFSLHRKANDATPETNVLCNLIKKHISTEM